MGCPIDLVIYWPPSSSAAPPEQAQRLTMVLTCEEEVEACFVRCKEIYGGTTMTDSYYCSKGCASMSSEDIVNLEKSARRRLSPK